MIQLQHGAPAASFPRPPVTHDLKIHPEPFAEARAGRKPFEVRWADRDFRTGDLVLLREWDPAARAYTGEELGPVPISCITRGYGLLDGYVVLGLGYGLPDFAPRLLDLQAEVGRRRIDAERWGAFIVSLADAIGIQAHKDFQGAGYIESDLLARAKAMATLVRPEAAAALQRALGLIQDAADTWLLGSGAGAKDKAAQAAVELLALIEGRA